MFPISGLPDSTKKHVSTSPTESKDGRAVSADTTVYAHADRGDAAANTADKQEPLAGTGTERLVRVDV